MIIEVRRTGGFAGLTVRAELDTEDRPDGALLVALAVAGGWGDDATPELPDPAAAPVPDGYVFTITVDSRAATVAEAAMPPPVRELADRTLAAGRRDPPG